MNTVTLDGYLGTAPHRPHPHARPPGHHRPRGVRAARHLHHHFPQATEKLVDQVQLGDLLHLSGTVTGTRNRGDVPESSSPQTHGEWHARFPETA